MNTWIANRDVFDLLEEVKVKHHLPRLEQANIAVCFSEMKPFTKDRFNWGKTKKFSPLNKLFHNENKTYDFLIILSTDAWHQVLTGREREALLDLHLTRCQLEYKPVFVYENGKKKPVKDKWGRTQYSNELKTTEDGEPIWKVIPLDLPVFASNTRRYGIWCDDLSEIKEALLVVRDANPEPEAAGFRGTIIPNAEVSWTANPLPAEHELAVV